MARQTKVHYSADEMEKILLAETMLSSDDIKRILEVVSILPFRSLSELANAIKKISKGVQ